MTIRILIGDCRDVLKTLPDASVDSIVTDPPYHLTTGKKSGSGPASVNLESPYGRARVTTGFMGMTWDGGDVAMRPDVWAECLRVLKPGGHLLAFSGTRTYHRMACAIEDAGFEIRDQIGWAYGSGFPKSRNLDGEWQGWGTALKPAWEPICVARKPLIGTVAENVLTHGTGALNIDGCRVPTDDKLGGGGEKAETSAKFTNDGWKRPWMDDPDALEAQAAKVRANVKKAEALGRWPANIIHDGSEEVLQAFPDAPGQQGDLTGSEPSTPFRNCYGEMRRTSASASVARGDTGSAARFFKECSWQDHDPQRSLVPTVEPSSCLQSVLGASVQSGAAIWASLAGIVSSDSKEPSTNVTPSESRTIAELVITAMAPIGSESSRASRHEKHSPCGSRVSVAVERKQTGTTTITANLYRFDGSVARATFNITPTSLDRGVVASRLKYVAKADKADRGEGNTHPTVKPGDLMRYLCRLVTPRGGTVLDPFAGSGSTLLAADREGFDAIGIEMNPQYAEMARRRIYGDAPLFAEVDGG